ncbi:MAG TPA: hypothetical protein VJN64_00915 [Terriglobales bacterium]|nr:hypothetical protein [Terriglobales bacterium]
MAGSLDKMGLKLSLAGIGLLWLCIGCGGGGATAGLPGGGGTTPSSTPTPTPTPVPTAAIVSLKVADAVVPPGGIYQYQLLLTEPKPIGNGSTRPGVPAGPRGPVRGLAVLAPRGVAINDASGQASGVAVVAPDGTITVKLTSPLPNLTLGTDISYPLFTMTMPVNATTTPGQVFPVTLDGTNSFFLDSAGKQYTQEIANGTLTIGGAGDQSITDVIPGGGLLQDRSSVRVLGVGFTPNTRITIEGTNIFFPDDTVFVNSGEIDVKLCNGTVDPAATTCPNTGASFQLDGERVRAINKDNNKVIEYFSYMRTVDAPGSSGNTLVAEVHPMFSRKTFNMATLPYVTDATHFTGLALQNPGAVDSTVLIEMLNGNGAALESTTIVLPAGTKIVRDIRDWFTIPFGPQEVTVRASVTTGPTLQMLGLLGDSAGGTVTPVTVTGQ